MAEVQILPADPHPGKKEREVKIYFKKLWCFRKTNETIEAGFTALFSQLKWREKTELLVKHQVISHRGKVLYRVSVICSPKLSLFTMSLYLRPEYLPQTGKEEKQENAPAIDLESQTQNE